MDGPPGGLDKKQKKKKKQKRAKHMDGPAALVLVCLISSRTRTAG